MVLLSQLPMVFRYNGHLTLLAANVQDLSPDASEFSMFSLKVAIWVLGHPGKKCLDIGCHNLLPYHVIFL